MLTLNPQPESELYYKLVREKSLPHPTARNFDPAKWRNEFSALLTPSPRDESLAVAAIYYGTELKILRKTFDQKIFKGMNRRSAKIFSAAFANREFFLLMEKVQERLKAKAQQESVARFDGLAGILVSNPQSGDELSPDSLTASIVDTLPHCVERAQLLVDNAADNNTELDQDHFKLYPALSIEHSIRNLWQSVLWKGASLVSKDNQLRQVPRDKALAEYELAWTRRIEGVATQGAMTDAIAERRNIRLGFKSTPYLNKTIVGVGTGRGGRSFKFGEQSGRAGQQLRHKGQVTILEDSYLADFLDVPLPATGKYELTCRQLHRIWCVFVDAVEVLKAKKKSKELVDFESAKQFSLLFRTSELVRAAVECGGLAGENAVEAVRFLSLDGSDAGAMFADGFWSRPVLAVGEDESALISPSLLVGNTIRRVEHWLARGGVADNLSNARRGLTFEARVRLALAEALEENELFSDSCCSGEGIEASAPDGEQIDLLFRIRDLVVVGEIKCLLAPAEPTEIANYLRKMKDACDQAIRKAEWLNGRRDLLVQFLNLSLERAAKATILPLVVTNQSFGASLVSGAARVIDFHFLKLYLEDGEYVAGGAFRQVEGDAVLRHETLYKSEEEAEQKFLTSIENLKPLKNYLDIVKWTETRFPLSNGESLLIENCVLEGNLTSMNNRDIELLFSDRV